MYLCKAEHGHETILNWFSRARQEDRERGAHNMGTCMLARLFIDVNAYDVFFPSVGHVLDMYWRGLRMVSGMCSACVIYVLYLLVIYIVFSRRPLPQLVMLVIAPRCFRQTPAEFQLSLRALAMGWAQRVERRRRCSAAI